LSEHLRRVFRLRIVLDDHYPGIIRECAEAMREVLPSNRQHVQPKHREHAGEVSTYSKQLICLFPQHGHGRKHDRRIALTAWQQDITARRPDLLLRGLIHSDGCRFINTVRHGEKIYEYPRYNSATGRTTSSASSVMRATFLASNGVDESLGHLGGPPRVRGTPR
jgi:hypothetical protein